LISVPYFGIKGVAFGLFIGNAFIFFLTLFRLMVRHGFSVPLNMSFLLAYTFSVLLLAGWVSSQSAEWDETMILYKIAFVVLFVASLFLFLNKEEKAYLVFLREKVFWRK
jgi:hypothetical protein